MRTAGRTRGRRPAAGRAGAGAAWAGDGAAAGAPCAPGRGRPRRSRHPRTRGRHRPGSRRTSAAGSGARWPGRRGPRRASGSCPWRASAPCRCRASRPSTEVTAAGGTVTRPSSPPPSISARCGWLPGRCGRPGCAAGVVASRGRCARRPAAWPRCRRAAARAGDTSNTSVCLSAAAGVGRARPAGPAARGAAAPGTGPAPPAPRPPGARRRLAATARVDEHHPRAQRRRRERGGELLAHVLHHHRDGRIVERHLHGAEQDQGAALGQGARVEHAAQVFGRERRHGLVAASFGTATELPRMEAEDRWSRALVLGSNMASHLTIGCD